METLMNWQKIQKNQIVVEIKIDTDEVFLLDATQEDSKLNSSLKKLNMNFIQLLERT